MERQYGFSQEQKDDVEVLRTIVNSKRQQFSWLFVWQHILSVHITVMLIFLYPTALSDRAVEYTNCSSAVDLRMMMNCVQKND